MVVTLYGHMEMYLETKRARGVGRATANTNDRLYCHTEVLNTVKPGFYNKCHVCTSQNTHIALLSTIH